MYCGAQPMEALKFCHRFAHELILIGLPLPLMHQLVLSLLGIGSYSGRVSGINFGGIQFLYPTDEK